MLDSGNAVFVLVDVQGKLATLMHGKETLFANLQILIRAMRLLDIPILWLEQIPEKMGETIPELRSLLEGESATAKTSFSGYGDPGFRARLEELGKKQVLLAGIETHVCVYQTAADLIEKGFSVDVVADAVSSRTEENKNIALRKISTLGGRLTTVEMLLFELMKDANHPRFRDILKLVK